MSDCFKIRILQIRFFFEEKKLSQRKNVVPLELTHLHMELQYAGFNPKFMTEYFPKTFCINHIATVSYNHVHQLCKVTQFLADLTPSI